MSDEQGEKGGDDDGEKSSKIVPADNVTRDMCWNKIFQPARSMDLPATARTCCAEAKGKELQ